MPVKEANRATSENEVAFALAMICRNLSPGQCAFSCCIARNGQDALVIDSSDGCKMQDATLVSPLVDCPLHSAVSPRLPISTLSVKERWLVACAVLQLKFVWTENWLIGKIMKCQWGTKGKADRRKLVMTLVTQLCLEAWLFNEVPLKMRKEIWSEAMPSVQYSRYTLQNVGSLS